MKLGAFTCMWATRWSGVTCPHNRTMLTWPHGLLMPSPWMRAYGLVAPHFSTSVTTPSTCLPGGKPSNPRKLTLKCAPSFKYLPFLQVFTHKSSCQTHDVCSEEPQSQDLRKSRNGTIYPHPLESEVLGSSRMSNKEEISFCKGSTKLPKTSPLHKLSPLINNYGLLRVGGQLERSNRSYEESHPLILLGSHRVTMLLVRHYNQRVQHQGWHFTLGLIRSSGLWIVGGNCKQLITVKPSEAYPSRLHQRFDYLNIEPASRFKNAIMNWLFEYWTR